MTPAPKGPRLTPAHELAATLADGLAQLVTAKPFPVTIEDHNPRVSTFDLQLRMGRFRVSVTQLR